jgi:hypothetical protein
VSHNSAALFSRVPWLGLSETRSRAGTLLDFGKGGLVPFGDRPSTPELVTQYD